MLLLLEQLHEHLVSLLEAQNSLFEVAHHGVEASSRLVHGCSITSGCLKVVWVQSPSLACGILMLLVVEHHVFYVVLLLADVSHAVVDE